ncbi:MAG: coproporphyrinogen III oxidase family protein [Epsilonproteobacteria bacterium]|nr:coproporphyrinogen III oxidase family protein [Campylobacterota bacterium]
MLYIHIPFCQTKCFYCAFNSFQGQTHLKDAYLQALIKQFQHTSKPHKFESIFIGGGTPSLMDISWYNQLFEVIYDYIDDKTEITIEANPNSADYEWIKQIRQLGVNRISFGVQSFNEEKLKFLGRSHSRKDAIRAISNAHKFFDNVNIDLMYSVAIDTKDLLKSDVLLANKLGVNHISAYSLTIEQSSRFNHTHKKDDEEEEIWMIKLLNSFLKQYEISNFGRICKHNLGYWQLKNYIGLGAGAVGFKNNKRFYPHKNIQKYINNPLFAHIEKLDHQDLLYEKVLLGLRSVAGFEWEILPKHAQEKTQELIKEGKLILKKGRVYSTDFLLADAISVYIL